LSPIRFFGRFFQKTSQSECKNLSERRLKQGKSKKAKVKSLEYFNSLFLPFAFLLLPSESNGK
jgi:hypothetical protein